MKKHFHLFLHRLHLPAGKTAPKPSSPSVYSKQDSQSKVSDERVPDFSCWDFFAAEESISYIFLHFAIRVAVFYWFSFRNTLEDREIVDILVTFM